MKVLILALVVICACSLAAQPVLTNDHIIKMVQAGISQDIVVRAIVESTVQFELAPDQLIGLKKAGVPDEVVRAMMARSYVVNQSGNEADLWAKHEASLPRAAAIPEVRRTEGVPVESSVRAEAPVPVPNVRTDPEAAQIRVESIVKPLDPVSRPSRSSGSEDGWALGVLRREITLSGGLNSGPHRINQIGISGTAGFALGIREYLAAFGSYGYNSLGSDHDVYFPVSLRLHEVVGGLRVSLPNRFSPYAELCEGLVRATGSTSVLGLKVGTGSNEVAFGGGFGFNYAITPHFGVTLEVRILKPLNLWWYGHETLGIYSRF